MWSIERLFLVLSIEASFEEISDTVLGPADEK